VSEDHKIRWPIVRRVGGEGVIIIASILLALAIDAWWESRSERIEEQKALVALEQDFVSASDDLAYQLLVRDSALVAANAILSMTGPNATAAHGDSLALLIPRVIRLGTFNPPLGTLDALLGSGDLRLIQDGELRAALASFRSALDGQRTTEGFAGNTVFGMFLPYLNQHLPLQKFGLRRQGASEFAGDPAEVLRSLEFENLVQNRLMNTEFLIDGLQGLQGRINHILVLLRREIQQ